MNSEFELPRYKHIPGVNPRPAEDFLRSVISLAPAATTDKTAAQNKVWRYGIRLFNEGFYWECHEVLETLWLRTLPNSSERFLLQGIIHLANSALKEKMQRPNAAQRLKHLALECFRRAVPDSSEVLMGLNVCEVRNLTSSASLLGEKISSI